MTYGAFLAAASGNGECLFDTRSACFPAPKGGEESTNLIINEGKRGGKLFSESVIVVSSFPPFVSCGKNAYPFHM